MSKPLRAQKNRYLPWLMVLAVLFVPAGFAHAGFFTDFLYKDIVIGVFGWIMGAGGVILEYALQNFVVEFGYLFGVSPAAAVVNTVWATVRDLFNLTFIFGLVYIGFKMILRTDDGQTKRWLVTLILAALLVNFSLFITKFVIDASNILAVQILNEEPAFVSPTNEVVVTEAMMDAMAVTGVLKDAKDDKVEPTMSLIFGTLMVFLVATFVFFSAGILIIVRGAILAVLMILSPFLFLGMVLPMFKTLSNKLWKTLFTRAFFAPVYAVFLYITVQLAQSLNTELFGDLSLGDGMALSDVADPGAVGESLAGSFSPFILISALLIISLVAGQKMGGEGAKAAMKFSHGVRKRAQNTVKWGASRTAGRAGQHLSNKSGKLVGRGLQRLQQLDTKNGSIATRFAKRAVRGTARTNAVQDTVGGAAQKMQDAKFGNKRTLREEQKMRTETNRRADQGTSIAQNLDVLNDTKKSAQQVNDAFVELAKTMGGMSAAELAKIPQSQRTDPNVAIHIKDNTIDSMEKAGDITRGEAQQMKESRKQAQINMAYTGTTTVQNPQETDPHKRVSANDEMRSASNAPGATKPQQDAYTAREQARSRMASKSSNAAEMPDEVFQNPDMYQNLSPTTVQNKAANVDNEQRVKMRDALLTSYGITPPSAGTPFTIAGSRLAGTPWEKWADRSPEGARFFSG